MFFSPLFGEDSHFDEHIFQMGGSTTNQIRHIFAASDEHGKFSMILHGWKEIMDMYHHSTEAIELTYW